MRRITDLLFIPAVVRDGTDLELAAGICSLQRSHHGTLDANRWWRNSHRTAFRYGSALDEVSFADNNKCETFCSLMMSLWDKGDML